MGRVLILLFLTLLTMGSLIGYLFLTEKIISGNLKVIEGQKQLEEGEQMLSKGKARLSSGKQRLSNAKNVYNKVKPLMWVATATMLPVAEGALMLTGNKMAKNKIAQGDRLVAQGQEKIKAGEKQLAEGKLELHRGMKRLERANRIRVACAIGTAFFASLLVVFGFYWRKSLIKLLKMRRSDQG